MKHKNPFFTQIAVAILLVMSVGCSNQNSIDENRTETPFEENGTTQEAPVAQEQNETFIEENSTQVNETTPEEGPTPAEENQTDLNETLVLESDENVTEANETAEINTTNEVNETIGVEETPPTIVLKGLPTVTLDISQYFDDPGVEAWDEQDGNLSANVVVESNLLQGVEGNYTVIYRVEDSAGNRAEVQRYIQLIDRLKALSTDSYRRNWFERAKAKWNELHPDNNYTYAYYTYDFPADGDRIAGTPPDAPISPKEWMQNAGLGFSKKVDFPYDESRYKYDDTLLQKWHERGFRNGRLHLKAYEMIDANDTTGMTLRKDLLEELKILCERFVAHGMPITISMVTGDELSDDMLNHRQEVFGRIISWWREIAAYMKNSSHMIAFENFVEYHGFDDIEIEKRDFEVELDNNETHYSGFENYKGDAITNWVRSPGYSNLIAEISKVIRITNPDRIVAYKANAIGRIGIVNVTPWRWRSEGDYLGITNHEEPYWMLGYGGSANMKVDFIRAIRSSDPQEQEELLESAKYDSWGPAVEYYNGTHLPVWISLWGIKLEEDRVASDLNGTDVNSSEIVAYIDWYQGHIHNDPIDEEGNHVRFSSGFQQTHWVWDYDKNDWFTGTLDERWEHFEEVGEALSRWALTYPQSEDSP